MRTMTLKKRTTIAGVIGKNSMRRMTILTWTITCQIQVAIRSMETRPNADTHTRTRTTALK